jgi:hypothetical protein
MPTLKNIFVFLTFFIFCLCAFNAEIYADTHTALTCSYSDVLTAYTAASAGDTVSIPAGSCTWTSALNITKSINLIGAGSSSTVISRTTSGQIINVTLATDVPIRISGIGFVFQNNTDTTKTAIFIKGSNYTVLTQVRIDHNAFTKGYDVIFVTGVGVFGVIDNNTFTNVHQNRFKCGDDGGQKSWNGRTTITAGSNNANALFIESNTIIWDNNNDDNDQDAFIYIEEGGVVVFRHNTIDATAWTNSTGLTILNNHGNQQYWVGGETTRAAPIFEAYNNTISTYKSSINMFGIRGGSVLIHDNAITTSVAGGSFSKLSEEEAWQTAFFSPLRTTWPAQDQVFNSFFWNNTWNGSPAYPQLDSDSGIGTFIQKNRDYFLHAPCGASDTYDAYGNVCTHGKESFTGSRKGGSTTAPTTGDKGSMIFTATGDNAYYPYMPYNYPHPLRQETGPNPPKVLRIFP